MSTTSKRLAIAAPIAVLAVDTVLFILGYGNAVYAATILLGLVLVASVVYLSVRPSLYSGPGEE